MIRIRTNVAKRWRKQIREASTPLTVLSPYITENKTLRHLADKQATFYTRFEVRDFVSEASTLSALRLLLESECKIYEVQNLHAKVILDESGFVTLGSQNLTFRGESKNKELSVCFDGEQRVETCKRVREVVSAWTEDSHVAEIDWGRFYRMEADVKRAQKIFSKFDKAMNKIQAQADEFQAESIKAVVTELERKRGARKASNLAALKKAVKAAAPSKIVHTGAIEEPDNVTAHLQFKAGVNLYDWNQKGGPIEKNSRCLCVLDDEHLGWVRLAGRQFTRIAREMVIGNILPAPYQGACVTLSVDNKDLRNHATGTNLVARIEGLGGKLCSVGMAFSINDLEILDIKYPKPKVNGKKPLPIQLLRVDLITWVNKSGGELETILMKNIASTTPLPNKLEGDDAGVFFGPPGTKVKVTMKFTGPKKQNPILVATRV